MIALRKYQQDCVDALYRYFAHHDGNPLIVLPTAAGKSIVQGAFIARAVADYPDERFLLITHVRELLQQNRAKLAAICPDISMGYYCAGLGEKRTDCQATLASIQSVHGQADAFKNVGLVIVDEAHLVPRRASGRYHGFFTALRTLNPKVKIIGMSATPYRMGSGLLHCGDDALFTDVAYEAHIKDLIAEGYLCNLVSKCSPINADVSHVRIRGGEYVDADLERACMGPGLVKKTCEDIAVRIANRKKALVFCVGVKHAVEVTNGLRDIGIGTEIITGETASHVRKDTLARFASGETMALVNVNVLTTGFDAPDVDTLIMLRPTMSVGLFVQMCGRGFRTHPGKTDCMLYDYTHNTLKHGPVDRVEIKHVGKEATATERRAKVCPQCEGAVSLNDLSCEQCGWVFPPPEERPISHGFVPIGGAILSGQDSPLSREVLTVTDVSYTIHRKLGKPPSLKVSYHCGLAVFRKFICLFHSGYAGQKAAHWWNTFSPTASDRVADERHMLELCKSLVRPTRILVDLGGQYPEILGYDDGSGKMVNL